MTLKQWWRLDQVLLVVALALFTWHWTQSEVSLSSMQPVRLYELNLSMDFESHGDSIHIATFLPKNTDRQWVVERSFADQGLIRAETDSARGLQVDWRRDGQYGPGRIELKSTVVAQAIQFELVDDLALPQIPSNERVSFGPYLSETEYIQVWHPELQSLWSSISPEQQDTKSVLQAIYDYTYQGLESADFKGTTDALTALRLGQASCNGRARLFIALARQNGLASRLVGGIVLDEGRKRTTHQWVEVFISGHWVPFDPTNGHFARLPENYLTLYTGDQVLFTYTGNINFNYQFEIASRSRINPLVTANLNGDQSFSPLVQLFHERGIDTKYSSLLLLFPLAALLVSFCRNVIGLQTLGVFVPMLIAGASYVMGLVTGLGGFLLISLLVAALRRFVLSVATAQIPRLAALITLVTLMILIIGLYFQSFNGGLLLAMLPVVILAFTAERLVNLIEQRGLLECTVVVISTCLVVVACYGVFSSALLQALFINFPELLLVVLAFQLMLARWSGLRVSEYFRFRKLIQAKQGHAEDTVLGINKRNIELVAELNSSSGRALVDDKVACKSRLLEAGVPVPDTFAVLTETIDLTFLERQLMHWQDFVIKPANGSQGHGILVIAGREGHEFIDAKGRRLTASMIIEHCRALLTGEGSGYRDSVLIERRIIEHSWLQDYQLKGLSDIRVLVAEGKVCAAMVRIPTERSEGKSNLHQGAVAVAVNLANGRTFSAESEHKLFHPDVDLPLDDLTVPHWARICQVAQNAQAACGIGYAGIDICIDQTRGPLVLEVNARPGLQIQAVQGEGLVDQLQSLFKESKQQEVTA